VPSWTNPKTWSTNEILTSPDMNTYTRDNTLHLFERIVTGTQNGSISNTTQATGTITFGVTFTAAPKVYFTLLSTDAGAPPIIQMTAAPTTTAVNWQVTPRDTGNFTFTFTIHWLAIGEQT